MIVSQETDLAKPNDTFTVWLNHAFIIVYFLQVVGLLSHPAVTMLWAME